MTIDSRKTTKPIKVAFVGLRGIPAVYGGVDRVVEEIGTGLAERGHQIVIYCWKSIYEKYPTKYKRTELIYLPTIPVKYLGTLIHTFLGCVSAICKKDIDIIHINNLENAAFALIPRLFGKRVVVQPHGPAWPVLKWGTFKERFSFNLKIIISRIFLYFCRFPTRILPHKVIVISGTDADYISRRKLDKFVLIHNGCDLPEPFPPEKMLTLGIKPKEYLLFVGRLDPRKGCHYLIQAFKQLETEMNLVIVGGPLESSYGKYIQRLAGNDKRIMFLGPVYDQCLNELFSNAYIYVHPSESEGQSIALLEGLAYGNCVITSDTPESVETAGQRACYFKAGDWEDLRRVLEEIIANPFKVEEKRIEAREHVKENYQWNDKILEYEALYSSILFDETGEK
jgi:glycosyltransferase involved in cell wall biosynthesis